MCSLKLADQNQRDVSQSRQQAFRNKRQSVRERLEAISSSHPQSCAPDSIHVAEWQHPEHCQGCASIGVENSLSVISD